MHNPYTKMNKQKKKGTVQGHNFSWYKLLEVSVVPSHFSWKICSFSS